MHNELDGDLKKTIVQNIIFEEFPIDIIKSLQIQLEGVM